MHNPTTLLASTLALACLVTTAAEAARPPALDTYVLGGLRRETTATFHGGATINNGASFLKRVPAGVPADLVVQIGVDPEDVGLEGDLYLVIGIGPDLYQWTRSGMKRWDFNGVDARGLEPFDTRTLSASESFTLRDVEARLGFSLQGRKLYPYFGYISDISKLNYSTSATFTVESAPANQCAAGGNSLPGFPGSSKRLCVLQGRYTSDLHLTSNFDYLLQGTVFIGGDNRDSASLTIDAGTTLYGQSGPEALVISRGSRIFVNGTPERPVVMTAAADGEGQVDATTRGLWGGLVINGNAPVNGCVEGTVLCQLEGEGNTGLYGGNNPDDSSGVITYLQVKYAGYEITPENELNGIAFQGVGRGTLIDYVQVHNNFDDGVEFFGGTADAKHLFLSGNGDDSLDWTFGWTGRLQHVVVLQTDRGDQGIEADNNAAGRDALPRSRPTIANLTLIGNDNTDTGILLREGTGARLYNVIVSGFGDDCLDIDHEATFLNAGGSINGLNGELAMSHSVVNCSVNFREELGDLFTVEDWFLAQDGNSTTPLGMQDGYVNTPAANARPAAVLQDSFFDQVNHIGAVKDQASDWSLGWTYRD